MWSKIWQLLLFIILASALTLSQLSFVLALPAGFNALNLIVICLVFIIFFYDLRAAIGFVLISGWWSELLSFHFFGFYTIILFLTTLLVAQILNNWLTNRSLYSFLLLLGLASFIYNFLVGIFSYMFLYDHGQFFLWRASFWSFCGYQLLWSLAAAVLLFSLSSAVTKRFKPFFLSKS